MHNGKRRSLRYEETGGQKQYQTITEEAILNHFNTLRYKDDWREPPDNRRRGQFKAGWNRGVRGLNLSSRTLNARLTWSNLGYRYGRQYPSASEAKIEETWDVLSARFGTENESKPNVHEERYWLMSLGELSKSWDSSKEDGIAVIGYDDHDLGDLRKYESQEQLKQCGLGTNDSFACWQFCREMKPGDTILVKRGTKKVLGHGEVRSDYRFENARPQQKHVRDVKWLSDTGGVETDWPNPFVLKTLTDITPYEDLVNALKRAIDPPRYLLADAMKDLFLSRKQVENLLVYCTESS